MSWTIEQTETNNDAIKDLEQAVKLAESKRILMFCASPDQGAFHNRSYPAASDTKRIFKIGAAEANGSTFKWINDGSAVDFIFPGPQAVMELPGNLNAEEPRFTPLSGSSVATALASGLAALILYCVQAGAIHRDREKPAADLNDYRALKAHDRMLIAFQQIGTSKESDSKYIMVWNRFLKPIRKAEKEPTRETWMDLVSELSEELMRD